MIWAITPNSVLHSFGGYIHPQITLCRSLHWSIFWVVMVTSLLFPFIYTSEVHMILYSGQNSSSFLLRFKIFDRHTDVGEFLLKFVHFPICHGNHVNTTWIAMAGTFCPPVINIPVSGYPHSNPLDGAVVVWPQHLFVTIWLCLHLCVENSFWVKRFQVEGIQAATREKCHQWQCLKLRTMICKVRKRITCCHDDAFMFGPVENFSMKEA